MYKTCKLCGKEKYVEDFGLNYSCAGGRNPRCKICVNELQRKSWAANRIAKSAKRSETRKKNIDKYKERETKYRKLYRSRNKEEIKRKYREYIREYRKARPDVRVQRYISYVIKYSMIWRCSTHEIFKNLGYTVEELMKHLEMSFKSGMSWDNYGEWHIDHIIPQSLLPFNDFNDENFLKCWSLSNLQPLWAMENLSKGNKILPQSLPL